MPLTEAQLNEAVAKANPELSDRTKKTRRTFSTYAQLKEFFQSEVSFWQSNSAGLPEINTHFRQIQDLILEAAREPDVERARGKLADAVSRSRQDSRANVYSETPFAKFLADIAHRDAQTAKGAYAYHAGTLNQIHSLHNDPRILDGVIAAIAFNYPQFFAAGLEDRIKAFDDQSVHIGKLREQITSQHRAFVQGIEAWKDGMNASVTSLIEESGKLFTNADAERKNTFQQARDSWQKEIEDLKKQVQELEALYREKLRLEAPAKYWKNLEDSYSKQGLWWTIGTAALVLVFAILATVVVYNPPALFNETRATLGGIKGALLIAATISLAIYLINLFIRMTTSAHHLARDARERYQLTHVFLALVKEGVLEPKDRELIVSALFSRADTGLLKYDSSPTVPTPFGSLLETLKK